METAPAPTLTRGRVIQGALGDLEHLGFRRSGKQLELQSDEMIIKIDCEVIPWWSDLTGRIKQCNLWYMLDDKQFPRDSSLDAATMSWHLDIFAGTPGTRYEYTFTPGQPYLETQLHTDMVTVGAPFFERMQRRDNYFAYLLGDMYKIGEGVNGIDFDRAVLALDLARKYDDADKMQRALDIIKTYLQTSGHSRSREWLVSRKAFEGFVWDF